jgi:hypothetical protein
MAAHQNIHPTITPATQILDDRGYDWSWAFVYYKPIPGWPGYWAGTDGSIWSRRAHPSSRKPGRWRLMRPHRWGRGYKEGRGHLMVSFCYNNKHTCFYIHQIILFTFVGPRPPGCEACHGNDDSSDNQLSNLRWDTPSANKRDAVRNGSFPLGEKRRNASLTNAQAAEIKAMLRDGIRATDIVRRTGVPYYTIKRIRNGKIYRTIAASDIRYESAEMVTS